MATLVQRSRPTADILRLGLRQRRRPLLRDRQAQAFEMWGIAAAIIASASSCSFEIRRWHDLPQEGPAPLEPAEMLDTVASLTNERRSWASRRAHRWARHLSALSAWRVRMTDNIVWISGATEGLGAGLAATVPYPGARVINLSRRDHPTLETVKFDLADQTSWDAVGQHFRDSLANFTGKRAIFIHNAFLRGVGYVTEVDREAYRNEFIANALAPLVFGDMFLSAVEEGYETGLVMISSAGARSPFEGHSAYCAAKAAVEMWVRTVRRELKRRGKKTWVVAVRPGFVDTPTTRAEAEIPASIYPLGPQIAAQLAAGEGVMTPEEAGRGIWSMLPPSGDESILRQGEMVAASPEGAGA
jgi:benzil reductase ((S)-benzoin forming)